MTLTVRVDSTRNSPLSRFQWGLAARQWIDQAEPLIRERLRQAAPVGQGPGAGRLRDSIRSEHVVSAANVVLTFTAHVPYAGFVVEGTAAHDIRPRNARVLHWTGPGGGVFAHLVHHLGTRPDPFAERAVRPVSGEVLALLEAAVAEQLNP